MATEASNSTTVPTNLHTQDLSQLDIEKLTPSTPEVISRQATINIGTIGHVAHGKSTIVKALSGVQTVRFKNELEKNITIKLERLEFDVNGEVIMPKELTSRKRKWEEDGDEKMERKPIKISSYAAKKGFFSKEYVVEKILDYSYQYGEHSFYVKWEGWNEDCNTWEPYEHLRHCTQRIEEYFVKVFNVDVINKMCKLLSVSQNLTNKSLESIIPSQGFNALKDKLQLQLELLSLNSKPIISAHYQKIKRGKENLLLYFLHTEREKQVKHLTEWENSVNAMSCEQASILVENEVDLEVLPDNFTYVNDYVPMEGVDIPQNPPIGCNCETCTPKESDCCGRNYSLRFTYRDKGRLNLSKGQPIYECNKMCTCDMSCRNRVIQNGRKIPLCIFRTNNGRGWGVKSTRKIYVGEFVCEYVGEVINHDEAEKRGEIYDAQGYANAKIYQCTNVKCPRPYNFTCGSSSFPDSLPCTRPNCTGRFKLKSHVSFVDCPGHDILMATMLTGTTVMDAALLLVAANESCPQPQTSEHLAAIEIMKLKNLIILQNKIDLVKEGQAKEQHQQILKFVQGTVAEGAPIIPISAQMKYNLEVLCEYIAKKVPPPKRDFTSPPKLVVVRSFDVNKPGCEVDDLKGGIAGGTILRGVLKVGQEIEIRPGIVSKDANGKISCTPIFSRIESLHAEQNELEFAVPGGLIGVGTKIDPTLCRADRLVGQILGAVGTLPDVFVELEVNYHLLKRLLGVRTEGDKKGARVQKITRNENLLINIGSLSTGGKVIATKADLVKVSLQSAVCTEIGESITFSRRIEKHWRLIGWGLIVGGEVVEPETN